MSSKKSKYTLLDKNQTEEYEMIQMVDMGESRNPYTSTNNNNQPMDYVKLSDQTDMPKKVNKQTEIKKQLGTSNDNKTSNYKPTQNKNRQQSYIYPNYSVNTNPTRINMNGSNFRMQNAQAVKKSKFPEMKVACQHCTFEQNVPANTQVYVCCCCNNMNQCFPLYGLFICGSCQGKVCYPYGTSDMIKCTRCGTINKVPIQPKKSYTKQISKPIKKPETLHKKIDKEEDEIIIQQADEPQRPTINKKAQQQQILFDQFSEGPQKKNSQVKYPDIL